MSPTSGIFDTVRDLFRTNPGEMTCFLVYALLILGAVAVTIRFIIVTRNRGRELESLADELQLGFSKLDPFLNHPPPVKELLPVGQPAPKPPGLPGFCASFLALGRGAMFTGRNVIYGVSRGRYLVVFDYEFTDGGGGGYKQGGMSAAVITVGSRFPTIFIRPTGFSNKINALAEHGDINFESREFAKHFHVTSPDRKFAYDVITAQMMEFLLAARTTEFLLKHLSWEIELGGTGILLWTGRLWKPGEARTAIEVLRGIADRIPRFVLKDAAQAARAGADAAER